MPRRPARRAVRAPAPLRIGSHNVRSLLGAGTLGVDPRLPALMRSWERQRLDVVCLQETWVSADDIPRARTLLHTICQQERFGHWTSWWSPAVETQAGRRSAGVAILVRTHLLTSGALTFPEETAAPEAAEDGRLLHLPVQWGGHAFTLLCAYLPDSNGPLQREFISSRLQPLAQRGGAQVWAGDFNFVLDPALDTARGEGRASDVNTARCFAAACPGFLDTFRTLHPSLRAYSYVWRQPASSGASRLDRVVTSPCLSPFLHSSEITPGHPSDHRLVVFSLAPGPHARPPGPGLPRLRLHFVDWPDLRSQLTDWLGQAAAAAPSDPLQLLQWWPAFKSALSRVVADLNRLARYHRLAACQQATQARTAAAAAQADLEAGDVSAAARVVATRAAAAAAEIRAAGACARRTRHAWLRTGERPSPALTALVRPPGACRRIPALRRPAGPATADPLEMPSVMAAFWQGVCTAATDTPATASARQHVLDALRRLGRRCPPGALADLGCPQVSPAEVVAALSATPPGRAPGADGIPADLYLAFPEVFAPLLAKVFSAIGATDQVPAGFLDGVISSFFKAGDPTLPANYRPITLLDTDYRTLARVLARRLLPVFGATIDPEQTAFLLSRRIGDNIWLLQLLPELLRVDGRPGVAVFLDFYKAYDTVDRPFLLACLETLGVGPGFLRWAQRLHSDTGATALVNGSRSERVPISAGVRQGCPLAPLLYLAVGQALLSWLRQVGVGLRVGADSTCTAAQYADDCTPFLASAADLPRFLAAMEVFRQASGQRLNLDKVELLPLGSAVSAPAGANSPPAPSPASAQRRQVQPPPASAGPSTSAGLAAPTGPLPGGTPSPPGPAAGPPRALTPALLALLLALGRAALGGAPGPSAQPAPAQPASAPLPLPAAVPPPALRSVHEAKTLGVRFRNDGVVPPVDTSKALASLGRVAALPLSVFGRAFAAGGYALSRVLYHMEFQGLPSRSALNPLLASTAAVVDRRLTPAQHAAAPRSRLVGVGVTLLALPPALGGFGLLPLAQHVQARHAVAAARCVLGAAGLLPVQPPWTAVALHLLRRCHPAAHPLCLLAPRDGTVLGRPLPGGCPALSRLVHAARCLGPPVLAGPDAHAGPWCYAIPLWGNPALTDAAGASLDARFPTLFSLRGLTSLGVAVRCWSALAEARALLATARARGAGASPRIARLCTMQVRLHALRGVLGYQELGAAVLVSGVVVLDQLSALLDLVPGSWLAAARQVLTSGAAPPSETEAWAGVARCLAWPRVVGPPVPLLGLTVKAATLLQLRPALQDLLTRHEDYVRDAYGVHPPPPGALGDFRETLGRLWRLRWENEHKEALWRLAAHGIAGFPMMRGRAGREGVSGSGQVVRCPCGAVFVRPGVCAVRRHLFWDCFVARTLLEDISETLRARGGVEVTAVERPHLWLVVAPAGLHARVWDVVGLAALAALERGRQRMYSAFGDTSVLSRPTLVRIGAYVVADFWARLASYAALGLPPPGWSSVPGDHPFLANVDGRVVFRGPPDTGSPPSSP